MTLEQLVARVLKLPPGDVREDSSRATLARWDSLRHVELMIEVEDRFQVKLTAQEVARIASLADIRAALQRRGIAA